MTEETQQFVRKEIRSEFTQLQKEQDKKWDEFTESILAKIDKMTPTNMQIAMFILAIMGLMVGAVVYVEEIKREGEKTKIEGIENRMRFEKYERDKQEESKEVSSKIDKIYDLAVETNKNVAVLQNSNEIEKNKQKVRDWNNK
jgi:hypothetical protein